MSHDYQAIYRVYLEMKSQRKAAARLGVSVDIVRRAMLECGHPPDASKQKVQDEVVLGKYEELGSCEATAEELQVSRITVWRVLKRHGLSPGAGRCRPSEKTRRVALPIEEIADRYHSGETTEELAPDYGVDPATIGRHLRKAGHRLRPAHSRGGEHHPNWQDRGKYEYRPEPPRRAVREYLGEPLPKGWIVHHIDEYPPNNSPDNLWIFESHSDHIRCHRLLLRLRRAGPPVPPIQVASEIGGQWLPRLRALRRAEPDKALLDLLRMPSEPWLSQTEFELQKALLLPQET